MGPEFSGKIAVITGATGGIGHATAALLAERGAHVVLVGREAKKLAKATSTICGADQALFAFANALAVEDGLAEIRRKHNRIDILVHAAGIYPTALVEHMDDAFAQSLIDVNLMSTIRLCRAAASIMLRQQSGAIVNVSSLASARPAPGLSAYSASKAGMDAFSKALALEVAPHVRVNLVSPGPTLTQSVRALMDSDNTGAVTAVTRDIPMKRLAEPREVAEAIAFLASDRASYITGAALHVNGGALMA